MQTGSHSLGTEDLVVDIVQRGAVGHVERPEKRASLLLDLLSLNNTAIIVIIIIFVIIIIIIIILLLKLCECTLPLSPPLWPAAAASLRSAS